MATATIRRYQQDCLRRNHFRFETLTSSSFRHRQGPNPNSNSMRSRRRKRSPVRYQGNGRDRIAALNFQAKNMVIGQVKILKRGQGFKPATNSGDEIQKQIRVWDCKVVDGLYAGSTVFLASPPPSSLPFPAFLAKKEKKIDAMASNCRAVALTQSPLNV